MGLDCYLTAKKYVSSYESENANLIEAVANASVKGLSSLGGLKYLECEAASWRKANQIHRWFVDNVQEGEDDCRTYYVERGKLTELLDSCKKVKENPSLSEHLLPTQGGFFFGGTEYDENYMEDIEGTIEALEKLVDNEDLADWSFYYRASW